MSYQLKLDADATAALGALPDELYERVNDLLDALEDDPRAPAFPARVHDLRDREDRPIFGLGVRAADGEVAVLWGVVDDLHVKVAYVGPNDTLRL